MLRTKKIILFIAALFISNMLIAQHIFKAIIKSKKDNEPLYGATISIKGTNRLAFADSNGRVSLKNIPPGKHVFV